MGKRKFAHAAHYNFCMYGCADIIKTSNILLSAFNSRLRNHITVLEITVGHRTLSDQILKMSGQLHIMIGHDDRTCHQHILSSLLQGVVSQ